MFVAEGTNLLLNISSYLHSTIHWRGRAPCAQNDQINVLAIGASQFRGNYLPLLQKLLPAHKVVLYSPSPFNKNTHPHPLIFLRGSMHQKSESVRREVI